MFLVQCKRNGSVRTLIVVAAPVYPDYTFHKDVFIPKELLDYLDGKVIKLKPSHHALNKLDKYNYSDRYPQVSEEDINKELVLKRDNIIEVGVKDSPYNIVHVLYREPLKDANGWDISYAIRLPEGFLKTFWLNESYDTHSTLNIEQYDRAETWDWLKRRWERSNYAYF